VASASNTPAASVTAASGSSSDDDHGEHRDPGEGHSYVAPNPVHGGPARVVYHMKHSGKAKLRLFQASGDPVGKVEDHHDTEGVHSSEVSTQRYAPGVYFCRVDLEYDDGESEALPLSKFIVLGR
jgi:hypothetical protein